MNEPAKSRILVVDDESQIRKFLRISLVAHGYEVVEASRGIDALEKCGKENPDLIILDLGLPDLDGQEVVRRIREWSRTPIIVLSVRSNENDKVTALDNGANDYVTKPFGIGELVARLRALLRDNARRRAADTTADLRFESRGLSVEYAARRALLEGVDIHLTRKEFDLLRLLTKHAGEVLTHDTLLRSLWGENYINETQYLRVHVGRLRQKLNEDPAEPKYIWTEPGVGYRFMVDE